MPTKKTKVNGVAVRAGLSLNRILYLPEELKKFSPTLVGKPILKDHNAATDNVIGLIEDTAFNNETTEVHYAGWIKEDGSGVIEKIDDGRIKEVSIGGVVGRLVKEKLDDDFYIAKDMRAMELSTTPTPAVVGTSITQTLKALGEATHPDNFKDVKPVFEQVAMINENFSNASEYISWNKNGTEAISESKSDISDKSVHKVTQTKIVERFVCPLCEMDLESVSSLRTHMKTHSEEPKNEDGDGVESEESYNKNNKEEIKMPEEQTINVKVDSKEFESKLKELQAKEDEFKKREEDLKTKEVEVQKKEDAIAKEKRAELEQSYNGMAKEKKVEARDISKLSDETVSELLEQLKLVKLPEEKTDEEEKVDETKEVEKKDETKGKVAVNDDNKEQLNLDGFVIEKSDLGKGYSLYRESYDAEKYPRLAR